MAQDERSTSDRLRSDIDHGRGGDKVSAGDPAAAPLGTDDEAAGTPPTQEQLARARAAEVGESRAHIPEGDAAAGEPARKAGTGIWMWGAIVLAIVVIVAVIAAA